MESSGRQSLSFYLAQKVKYVMIHDYPFQVRNHPKLKTYAKACCHSLSPDTCFTSLFVKVSSECEIITFVFRGKELTLLTPVVAFRSLESRKEREQVSNPRLRWNRPRDRAVPASSQPVRMPAQR